MTLSNYLVKTPDIGGDSGEIIEILVKEGDQIEAEQSVVVLESEKASMEVPSPQSGTIIKIHVSLGDTLSEGDLILELEAESGQPENKAATKNAPEPEPEPEPIAQAAPNATEPAQHQAQEQIFQVPDLGSDDAEVIEISVKEGEEVSEGDTLLIAESDKASLELPAETSGRIVKIHVGKGSKISAGMDLVTLQIALPAEPKADDETQKLDETENQENIQAANPVQQPPEKPSNEKESDQRSSQTDDQKVSEVDVYAGPAVRKLARELGVNLGQVKGQASGPRGRILKEDLHAFVKARMQSQKSSVGGAGIPDVTEVEWAKFGSVSTEPLSKIHRLTADNMHRSWLNVPRVTQWDDADVTELEEYRRLLKSEGQAKGIKMTPLAFVLKIVGKALAEHPKMNAAIQLGQGNLLYRKYLHLGVAVDTPAGLVVPVIRDVEQKDIWQLAAEIAEMADKAKNGKLKPADMQGACFTISSLGTIGGRGFTPIVPAPQAAILGVSKTSVQPVWDGQSFQPRSMMPLSLSYDHRVVNGADAGRFLTDVVGLLGSVENIWLN